jgi:hypothetical protein
MKAGTRQYSENKLRRYLGRTENETFVKIKDKTENGHTIVVGGSKVLENKFKSLIINHLQYPGIYLKKGLMNVLEDYRQTTLYRDNILKIGRDNAFKEYLQGLPTILRVPFMYGDIADIMAKYTEDEGIKDLPIGDIDDFYWMMLERAFESLLNDYQLKSLTELDLID